MTAVTDRALLDIARAATATVMDVPAGQLTADSSFAADLAADSLAMIEIVEVAEELLVATGIRVRVDDVTLAGLSPLAGLVGALRKEAEG